MTTRRQLLIALGGVLFAVRDDRRLADQYRAALEQAHGSYFGAVRLVDAANRPGDEADREGAERGHRPRDLVNLWEEEFGEDERRGGAVEEEVVPLDRGADEAGRDDAADRCW